MLISGGTWPPSLSLNPITVTLPILARPAASAALRISTPERRENGKASLTKTIFGLFVFVFVSHFIDLFLALIIFSFLISYWWGEKNILLILSLSIIFPILVFILFEVVLGLRFPSGILTNLYYN